MELEKYRNDQEVSQSFLANMEAPDVTWRDENHRDYNVRKSLKCSKRASQVENVLSVILCTIHHIRLQWKTFYPLNSEFPLQLDYVKVDLLAEILVQLTVVTHHIYLLKTRTSKHKNTGVLLCVNDSCGLNNCYSIKCNKQSEKYCFSRENIFANNTEQLNRQVQFLTSHRAYVLR